MEPAADVATHLVWMRDQTPTTRGWLKFAVPAVVLLCGFGTFAQYMSPNQTIDSVFPALAVIAVVLFFAIPWVYDRNKRRNPTVHLVGRDLAWGKKRVPIDQVSRFAVTRQSNLGATSTSLYRYSVGSAAFTMQDGTVTTFTWPSLPEAEVETLGAALEQILPGRRIVAS